MSNATTSVGRLRGFAYVDADKAAVYRAIMRVFTDAKARFALHLRPAEIVTALAGAELPERVVAEEVEAPLAQLCEWGNLAKHPDTADVTTVEEFYRPRFLFRLTPEGEAAERAIALYHEALRQPGELQTAALSDIQALLGELEQLAAAATPDDGKVHRTLQTLRARFEELTSKAQTFISSLQRAIDLHGLALEAFLAYKEKLIDYLERFIGELVIASADIATLLVRIEAASMERLLDVAARRDLADALQATPDDHAAAGQLWRERWAGLRSWFIGRPGSPAQAEVLRARARAAIPALLAALAGINDRRVARSDRSTDLRALARWFAETDNDCEAHRLWRAAFGLSPARHLRVDDATLDERDEHPVSAQTSWLQAPPLWIAPRLRRTGRQPGPGKPKTVIDRRREKALLAQAAVAEARQIAEAQRRLADGRRLRLSEIGRLDAAEFELFLDLLGEALARKVRPSEAVEAASSDGTLRIVLQPTGDGAGAEIETGFGRFSGSDHYVEIHRVFDDGSCQKDVAPASRNATEGVPHRDGPIFVG
ncbi:MAG TPA: TIGR02677 family protein [Pirellulales bacterium]|nr:TIGR02677 family protein [Pirellulales bacterium]